MKYNPIIVLLWMKACDIPRPELEYHYAEPRKFRADFAWPAHKLLLEVQGGIFGRGGKAHGSISGILKDNERLNHATLNGWRVLRVIPDKLCMHDTAEMIKEAMRWKP